MRPRRRTWPRLLLAIPLLWLAVVVASLLSTPEPDAPPGGEVAGSPEAAPLEDEVEAEPDGPVLATFESMPLYLPTAEPVLVGFHEASSDRSLAFTPVGEIVENANSTKFDPPEADEDGAEYLVLSSRGRPFGATSAVDVVMREGDQVQSPINGTVTRVEEETLYEAHDDLRIELAPAERDDLRLVIIHMVDARVEVGDEVVAGETVLADSALLLPFSSQIDRYTEPDRHPHVHMELKRHDAEVDG